MVQKVSGRVQEGPRSPPDPLKNYLILWKILYVLTYCFNCLFNCLLDWPVNVQNEPSTYRTNRPKPNEPSRPELAGPSLLTQAWVLGFTGASEECPWCIVHGLLQKQRNQYNRQFHRQFNRQFNRQYNRQYNIKHSCS